METNPISLRNAELRLNFAIGCFSSPGSILSSLPEGVIQKIQEQISAISFGDWLSIGQYSDYWEQETYPLPCFEDYLHIPATDFRKSVNHYGLEYLFTYWDSRSGVNRILAEYSSDLKEETPRGQRYRDLLQKSENAKKELLIRLHEELKFPLSEEQISRVYGVAPMPELAPTPHPYTFGEWLKMNDSPCGDGPNGEPCAIETETIHPVGQPERTGKQYLRSKRVVRNRSLLYGNDVLQRIFQDLLNMSIDEIKSHQGIDRIKTALSHLETGNINMDLSRKFRARFNNEISPENPLPVTMREWLLNGEALDKQGIKCGSILPEFEHAFNETDADGNRYLDYTTDDFRTRVNAETLQNMLDTGDPRGGKIRGLVVKAFLWRLHNELDFPLSDPQKRKAGVPRRSS